MLRMLPLADKHKAPVFSSPLLEENACFGCFSIELPEPPLVLMMRMRTHATAWEGEIQRKKDRKKQRKREREKERKREREKERKMYEKAKRARETESAMLLRAGLRFRCFIGAGTARAAGPKAV